MVEEIEIDMRDLDNLKRYVKKSDEIEQEIQQIRNQVEQLEKQFDYDYGKLELIKDLMSEELDRLEDKYEVDLSSGEEKLDIQNGTVVVEDG